MFPIECPRCRAEWEPFVDRDPAGIQTTWFACGERLTRRWPIRKSCCPACALETAGPAERVRFVKENDLVFEFCGWLFESPSLAVSRPGYVRDVFALIERHDPELLEQMAGQFVEDEYEDEFIEYVLSQMKTSTKHQGFSL